MNDDLRQLIAEIRTLKERVSQLEAANLSLSAADILAQIKTVDGASSGLDADTLDTYEAAAFGRLATANTWTATQTIGNILGVTNSVAANATVTLPRTFGLAIVINASDAHLSLLWLRATSATAINTVGSISTTKDTASNINVYYESGSMYVQNKFAAAKVVYYQVLG